MCLGQVQANTTRALPHTHIYSLSKPYPRTHMHDHELVHKWLETSPKNDDILDRPSSQGLGIGHEAGTCRVSLPWMMPR
jgi:hypothetical protein